MTAEPAPPRPAFDELVVAVGQVRDAVETIAGLVDLGNEAVFVRENLDAARAALDAVTRAVPAAVPS